MARHLIAGKLMGARHPDLRFIVADESHDFDLRRLLREGWMDGRIRLALQREPSYFKAASVEGCQHQTIIALHGQRVVCMGSVSVRERFYNGRSVPVGYLGGLRLDPQFRGRLDVLRGGYGFFRQLHEQAPLSGYLTSIAADNLPAIRLLERGLPGFPEYHHAGDLATVAIRVRPRAASDLHLQQGTREWSDAICQFLNDQNPRFQFAPRWSQTEFNRLEPFSLRCDGFRLLLEGDRITGCAALWDQRPFKQVVAKGYSQSMTLLRPLYNSLARLRGRVILPRAGQVLQQAYVSHLALVQEDPQKLVHMLLALMPAARSCGTTVMVLGLDVRDPRLAAIERQFGAHVYRTRLYVVRWPNQKGCLESPDGRLMYPEVALL